MRHYTNPTVAAAATHFVNAKDGLEHLHHLIPGLVPHRGAGVNLGHLVRSADVALPSSAAALLLPVVHIPLVEVIHLVLLHVVEDLVERDVVHP